jgi:hypothetical protein
MPTVYMSSSSAPGGKAEPAAHGRQPRTVLVPRQSPVVGRPSSIVYRLSSIVPQALALKHCDCRQPYTSLGRLLQADRTAVPLSPRPRCCCALPLAVPTSDPPCPSKKHPGQMSRAVVSRHHARPHRAQHGRDRKSPPLKVETGADMLAACALPSSTTVPGGRPGHDL